MLNGADTEARLEALAGVRSALQAALDSLAAIRPNGRDYAAGELEAAVAVHASRCERVRLVQAEIDAELDGLGIAW